VFLKYVRLLLVRCCRFASRAGLLLLKHRCIYFSVVDLLLTGVDYFSVVGGPGQLPGPTGPPHKFTSHLVDNPTHYGYNHSVLG